MTQSIPLVDLKAQLPLVEDEIRALWDEVLKNTAFIMGPTLARFETAFASYCGAARCVGVNSGTDALEMGLRALGVGAGDEVIIPANTFIASAVAIARAGATPVLVDCDPVHHLIEPGHIEAVITDKTKAIMPVHLYGQLAPMAPIQAIAKKHALPILEDAAQAHGAEQDGKRAGSFGAVAGFSFYPGKNLGAFGDGGAVVTASEQIAETLVGLRNFGSHVKYEHPVIGFNTRLDPLQSVVLEVKLKHLDGWNEARRVAAARYEKMLSGVGAITLPSAAAGNQHIWHLYVIRVPERDRVLAALHEAKIGAGIHYPTPVHLHGAFADLGHSRGAFPVAEKAGDEILSLPLFAEITAEQQERVVSVLRDALG